MAGIRIRSLDERTKRCLRVQAADHNRSMEEEARKIQRAFLAEEVSTSRNLGATIRERFEPHGGIKLQLPPRETLREPEAGPVILLDTNVLSELMRPTPEKSVVAWIAAQPTRSLYPTSITQAEILHSGNGIISLLLAIA